MSEVSDLKAQKERLLLERDIRRLERKRKIELSASNWSWWWVTPLTAIGAFFFLGGVVSLIQGSSPIGQYLILVVLSGLALIPVLIKTRYR